MCIILDNSILLIFSIKRIAQNFSSIFKRNHIYLVEIGYKNTSLCEYCEREIEGERQNL